MAAGLAHASCAIRVRRRGSDPRNPEAWSEGLYVSSQPPETRSPAQWLALVREHWGGCENRNHWRKDAVLDEDATRSRHPGIATNLALLRNLVIHFYTAHADTYRSLPEFIETAAARPAFARRIVTRAAG